MSSGAIARLCLATVLSIVALVALFAVWLAVAYGLNESGFPLQILLIAVTLFAMVRTVGWIFTLLRLRPNRHRRLDH